MAAQKKGFTLMELMVVVAIIGLIAAFAIPSYQRMMNKADERNAITNLATIRGAVEVYYARTGSLTVGNWGSLGAIRMALDIGVQDSKMSYSCSSGSNSCSASPPPGGWTIRFSGNPTGRIYCSGGTCPSCGGLPAGCGY